ncbi:amino acid ABC transporter permease [Thermobrachium celere]|uniref:ABC transporter membrane-spanning permease-glutamine transport n=1 Tax=Thermobrachium celere DSM 8682 TaxID=941824 RepID=R7RSP3_9CLOT|nr:amino acid ABC transporter permease [Thermobrachium celere]CDF59034.1 ABC transporter membrane-spanning permease-glutamine transport [Thermobrachium celere DSM 8682]
MNYIVNLLLSMKGGMFVTIYIFFITLVFSIILGIITAMIRISNIKIIRVVVSFYIFIMRGTPLLLQIIFIFFGLPMIGVTFERYTAVFIAFILNYTAYFTEIFRAGIQSIDKGQFEAAKVLGLSKFQSYRYIILPQMFKNILPALANEVITLVKDTSLVYVVGIADVLREGKIAVNRDATLLPFLVVAMFYAGFIYVLSDLFKKVERRFEYYR